MLCTHETQQGSNALDTMLIPLADLAASGGDTSYFPKAIARDSCIEGRGRGSPKGRAGRTSGGVRWVLQAAVWPVQNHGRHDSRPGILQRGCGGERLQVITSHERKERHCLKCSPGPQLQGKHCTKGTKQIVSEPVSGSETQGNVSWGQEANTRQRPLPLLGSPQKCIPSWAHHFCGDPP